MNSTPQGSGTGTNSTETRLEWRESTGDTAMFAEMLAQPMEVHFYEEVFVVSEP